ncbi:MAG: hypothetical protein KF865_10035 [Bdellovibrionaceae bacterium]|nr:hypothetical protein [Pseudobdellovibrionaceae bacterium]
MKKILVFVLSAAALTNCKSNPHKAEEIDTKIESSDMITGDTSVGVKDGNMIVQKKVRMNEELRRLQYEVYELEDRVFGNRKYGSLGLYGVLRDCRLRMSDPKNGGDGKLKWTEPMDRVTDKEDEFKIGVEDNTKLVGVSEEFLKDRLDRFKGYKSLLHKRQDEYEEKVSICKAELRAQKASNGTVNE